MTGQDSCWPQRNRELLWLRWVLLQGGGTPEMLPCAAQMRPGTHSPPFISIREGGRPYGPASFGVLLAGARPLPPWLSTPSPSAVPRLSTTTCPRQPGDRRWGATNIPLQWDTESWGLPLVPFCAGSRPEPAPSRIAPGPDPAPQPQHCWLGPGGGSRRCLAASPEPRPVFFTLINEIPTTPRLFALCKQPSPHQWFREASFQEAHGKD